ncbi:GTP-binding protein rhoA [Physcia stellaris]|nr:GTP-binding protein rhoA [Physcia stellaris]
MDKIIRRTEYAKAYRARQKLREAASRKKHQRSNIVEEHRQVGVARHKIIKEHKAARREDWLLGPLAPRRDAGAGAATFGTVPQQLLNVPEALERKKWGIRKGDRVACDVAMPEHLLVNDPDKTPSRAIEVPIPLSSLHNHRSQKRYITGTSHKLAWPPPDERPARETHDSDTSAEDARLETFIPTLIQPPMPASVIDELRNKYSKYRDRHDESYIAYKNAKAERREKEAEAKRVSMMSPMEEWRWRKMKEVEEGRREKEARRKEREARGEVVKEEWEEEMGEGLLVGIGRVMAENKGGWMERKGIGKEVLLVGEVGVGKEEAMA